MLKPLVDPVADRGQHVASDPGDGRAKSGCASCQVNEGFKTRHHPNTPEVVRYVGDSMGRRSSVRAKCGTHE